MRFPVRKCNGGQYGPWCGVEAEYVATAAGGLQWFCCEEHRDAGDPVEIEPIEEWYARHDMSMTTQSDLKAAERDAAELLKLLEGEPR